MKKILTILFSFSVLITLAQVPGVTKLSGQSGATVGSFISGAYATPAASAILEGRSTTKGFLEPRLTTAQMLAISAPADGLQVFNIDSGKPYYYFDSVWYQISATGASSSATLNAGRIGYGSGTNTLTGDTGLRYIPGGTPTLYVGTLQACGSDGYYGGAVKSGIYEGVRYDITNNLADSCDGSVALQYPFGAQTVFAFPNNPSADDSGQFLHNIGNGITRWDNIKGFAWGLTGNSGTDTATNYIGTSDATDLIIKSNTTEMIRLSADGNYYFPFDPTQKAVTFGNVNSFFKFGEYYGLKLIAANNVDIASFQGLDADSIFTDFHSNGSFFGNTPEQAQIIYKKNNWQFGYFNSFDSNGEPFANIFYAKLGDTITRPRDVARVLVSRDQAHIKLLLDTNGWSPTYNGLDVTRNYVQMGFAKDEEAQATGWSWTLDSISGLTFWSSGSNKFSIDTNGLVSYNELDSATIYALTPTKNATVYCNNCTGNGITGRIVAYIGAAWRRLLFD